MAGVPAVQRSEQRKIDAAWDLAAGYSAQFVSKRIECDAATLSRWLAEPEFAETVQLCRQELAKNLGDMLVARANAAQNLVVAAILGEVDLTDRNQAARVALADAQLARGIDRLFDDPEVVAGWLTASATRSSPAIAAAE